MSFQPRLWLKKPTWAAGKYTRGIMKTTLMVARMVPKNRPLSVLPSAVERHLKSGYTATANTTVKTIPST